MDHSNVAESFRVSVKMEKKTVLVTGGTGYIGAKLLESMSSEKYDITSTTRQKESLIKKNNLEFEFGDLKDKSFLDSVLKKNNYDYLFHMAAQEYIVSVDNISTDFHNNCEPFLQILNHVRVNSPKTKVIFLSSVNVFGSTCASEVNEETLPVPESYWSSHKLLCHDYCRYFYSEFGVKSNILLLPNIYGFSNNPLLTDRMTVNKIIKDSIALERVTLFQNSLIKRNFLFVDDLINALIASLDLKNWKAEKYCIGDGAHFSFEDLCLILKDTIPNLQFYYSKKKLSNFEMRDYCVSAEKFFLETGWQPKRAFKENILKTYHDILKHM